MRKQILDRTHCLFPWQVWKLQNSAANGARHASGGSGQLVRVCPARNSRAAAEWLVAPSVRLQVDEAMTTRPRRTTGRHAAEISMHTVTTDAERRLPAVSLPRRACHPQGYAHCDQQDMLLYPQLVASVHPQDRFALRPVGHSFSGMTRSADQGAHPLPTVLLQRATVPDGTGASIIEHQAGCPTPAAQSNRLVRVVMCAECNSGLSQRSPPSHLIAAAIWAHRLMRSGSRARLQARNRGAEISKQYARQAFFRSPAQRATTRFAAGERTREPEELPPDWSPTNRRWRPCPTTHPG